jgi:glutaredoxin 3
MMTKTATLYRMVLPGHECPYGRKAKEMLDDAGFEVDDQLLTCREEVDAFKEENGLDTTPLIIIDGEKIAGADKLADRLGATAG